VSAKELILWHTHFGYWVLAMHRYDSIGSHMSTNGSWCLNDNIMQQQWNNGNMEQKWNPLNNIGNIMNDTWEQKQLSWSNKKQLSSNTNLAQLPYVVHDTHMRMVRAHDKRITELQKECDKLKRDIEGCRAKIRKLQQQLMNEDGHQGQNTLTA
jgi:hypothetical protein